ncbi:MAG: hypothetical protein EAZ90_14410 [Oscillatoriales cyanobacterium]|jgi:hypothetical protein|nr:MAG: hypothetical protein EAZ94_05440 [Oscillatoriales cyanobacterium]TAE27058.1 MAG: hypothetical protein EAZ93_06580 [Oscillatoriales cyanobacterium]TAE42628.1 MAG: hypothetical protein EAZ90_14410 [Oscillatoriales cyanobacterium]TAE53206.1 MAG: hypothetical protein EAZ88_12715 [Oscillatoriales cyanobacterium]TAE67782.1 MAG: hypothetical protein EAZ86_15435 [Oscillatoriales cyanobacterium]
MGHGAWGMGHLRLYKIGNWEKGRRKIFFLLPLPTDLILLAARIKKYFPKHLTNWRAYPIVVIRDQCGTGGIGRRA